MKKDTLYVTDLDGTLLGTDSRISQRSAEIISELTDRGAFITVATARTPATVVPILEQTRTTPPAVVMTGTAYWDRCADMFTDVRTVDGGDVEAVLDFCRLHDVHPFVYLKAPDGTTMDVYHAAPELNKAERNFYEERAHLKLKRFHLGTPAPALRATNTLIMYAMGDARAIRNAYHELQGKTDCSVFCYPDIFNSDVYNLEIFPPGVNKAEAILRLKERLGARRLVVFGDNLNDLPMLAVADVAVAVGNALPEVKEKADIVIEPNYTDSVARFIEADFNS